MSPSTQDLVEDIPAEDNLLANMSPTDYLQNCLDIAPISFDKEEIEIEFEELKQEVSSGINLVLPEITSDDLTQVQSQDASMNHQYVEIDQLAELMNFESPSELCQQQILNMQEDRLPCSFQSTTTMASNLPNFDFSQTFG